MWQKILKVPTPILLFGAFIFVFIVAKASVSSFTHDESFTYLYSAHGSFMDIISHKNWYSNNHLLNSLFIKYSEQLFGSSETALRLPNLLMLLVYMAYGYLLFRRTDRLLAISVFVLLCTNVLLIDLFGLARGYGLSCGFMLMSLFHFIQSFRNKKNTNLILFHIATLLAVLSHFTLLTYYATLLLVYNIVVYLDCKFISNNDYHFFKENKLHIAPLLVALAILYEPVRRVIKFNSFDGGKDGFYSDTVISVIQNSLHNAPLSPITLLCLQIVFTCIVMISLIIIIWNFKQKNATFFEKHIGLIVSNFLLIFISIAIVLQHIIIGTDYLIARFAIFLSPIYTIHIGFLLYYFLENGYRKYAHIVALGLSIISITSFGLKANLHVCREWYYDAETKHMIQKLESHYLMSGSSSDQVKLGANWLFEPTINFYRETHDLKWLEPAHRNGISDNDDYQYIFKENLTELNPSDYEIIFEFERTNTVLLRNLTSR